MKFLSFLALLVLVLVYFLYAKSKNNGIANFKLDKINQFKVIGTSNIQDWEMKAWKAEGDLTVKEGRDNEVYFIASHFTIRPKDILSGNNSMDKKAHDLLKAGDNHRIKFVLLKHIDQGAKTKKSAYQAIGYLTVSGIRKLISIEGNYNFFNENVRLEGRAKLKFSDFEIEPPVALLGTMRTSEDITVLFDVNFSKLNTNEL